MFKLLSQPISQTLSGLAFALAAATAYAGSYSVSPVRATLSATKKVDALTITNQSDKAAIIQMQLLQWQQQDGKDIYSETQDILATPPVFTVPPNSKQVVRLGLRRAPDSQQELSYRLFLKEVPPPPRPDFQGIQMALQISIPVFVSPPVAVKPALAWRATLASNRTLNLHLHNQGLGHIQISQLRLMTADGSVLPSASPIAGYVLPQQQRQWSLNSPPTLVTGAKLHLEAQTDAGTVQADILVEDDASPTLQP